MSDRTRHLVQSGNVSRWDLEALCRQSGLECSPDDTDEELRAWLMAKA